MNLEQFSEHYETLEYFFSPDIKLKHSFWQGHATGQLANQIAIIQNLNLHLDGFT